MATQRGTGLPTIDAGGLSPLVDMSAYGAAERANAEGLARAVDGLSRFQNNTLGPLLQQKGREDAAKAVSEGRFEQRDQITEYGQSFTDAMVQGTAARMAIADDASLDGLMAANPYDPDAFATQSATLRTEVLRDTPGAVALQRAATFDRRRDQLLSNMRLAKVRADTEEAGAALVGRKDELVRRIIQNAEAEGTFDRGGASFAADLEELNGLWSQIADNPVLGVSPEQGQRLKAADEAKFQAAAVGGYVRRVFREQGAEAALLAARELLPPVEEPGPAFVAEGAQVDGLLEQGNIDIASRPQVQNADGSVSTVRSISVEVDGRTYLVPTVSDDGELLSDDAAIAAFEQTGRHLGAFASREAADSYAQALHEDQAARSQRAEGGLSRDARPLAYDRAMAVIAEESGLQQQLANIAAGRRAEAKQRVNSLIEAMRYGAAVDFDELTRAAQASGDPGVIAEARFAMEVGVQPPAGFGSGAGAGGGFDGDPSVAGGFEAAVDFVIDQIEGGETFVPDDNGRGPTRWGINASANPDLDIRNLSRAGAVARYRRDYWNAIQGDTLPPALGLVAFDAAVNQGPENARRWIAESQGDVGRFLALREAHYRSLAQDPKNRKNLNGWLNRLRDVRQRAVRIQAFQANQDGFASDPISFAVGNANRPALAQVAPLAVDAVFSAQGQAAWAQSIQARAATGETLARQYQVPKRILTDAEASAYKDRFERDPASILTFARSATNVLGGQGARDLLLEVGQAGAAPTLIHIAELGRPGGDVRFAQQAAVGISLKAGGQQISTERREGVQEEVNRWRSLLAGTPDLLAAVQNSAMSAALADEVSGVERPDDYYPQAALGRTTWGRNRYGGAAEVNGRAVVLPRWLNGEYFDDALEALGGAWNQHGNGPVYSNGDPIPARAIARLRPVLMPNGRYQLIDQRGNHAMSARGVPFEADLDRGRDWLRRRLGPNAVRPD